MYKEYMESYRASLFPAIESLDPEQFGKMIDIFVNAYKNDKTIFIMGNGGSAGTANHFVCDFNKNAVVDPAKRRFRVISVSDNVEKITALGNDIAFDEIFRQQLINLMRPEDVLISVSASGSSPDLVKACEYAKELGGHIITLSGFSGGKTKAYAEASLVAPLTSYEQIEDIHLMILHMIVYFFKQHQELLEEK